MPYKINVSSAGKTLKYETENENLAGTLIGGKISGSEISGDLNGYELEITGTSDKAGFPGFPEQKGPQLRKVLLKRGRGMWDKRKGVRLRKSVRGNEISSSTVQINTKVLKEGGKKFDELFSKVHEQAAEAEQKQA